MKKILLLVFNCFVVFSLFAENDPTAQAKIDSIESTFKYQHGKITLRNGLAALTVPAGFKYLDAAQAEYVLTELWGNPKGPDMSLGMLVPENQGILSENSWVFNIQYDEIGYVKDDDADDINYDDLLKELQEETEAGNKDRTEAGYDPISLVGWAAKPYYDADRKILHWAKEIKFGTAEENTLNYNIRILGRKGVMVLNAIGTMNQLPDVNKNIASVLNVVEFEQGSKYSDFNPDLDEVATWTIGSLVAGKVLAKVGVFAGLLKFWKVIALALVSGFGFLRRLFGRKQEENHEVSAEEMEAEAPTEIISPTLNNTASEQQETAALMPEAELPAEAPEKVNL
ncbi:DUF2167 domain-containing protein [Adhaeribacter soli]|uniref:DUF2167 domain-containing protein n=1 Tax=Adhaeribacter soli TaxID=2607655 RepID=A0A5N1IPA4_9BACT|nr:DUF2167 domain-containing protein [Adhaeribacter soli]KAA9331882.1 DUF2167 domain-containing protein [Adhaeribacter soli]